jgi:hypothetical protein
VRTFNGAGPSGPERDVASLNERRRPGTKAAASEIDRSGSSNRRVYSPGGYRGQVIRLGLVDADLLRKVKLLGHLGAARVLADADANFLIRSWLDTRIGEELARRSSYEGEP